MNSDDVQQAVDAADYIPAMAQVVQEQGPESIEGRVRVDATGARFNSIMAVEAIRTVIGAGAPEMNPLVNPGAIATTSMVIGASADEVWSKISTRASARSA